MTIKTNGPVTPESCHFIPAASIVLDPVPLAAFGGIAALDAWCAKMDASSDEPGCHREGNFVYFRYTPAADELRRTCPLFRSPVGDREHWREQRASRRIAWGSQR
jgi:hypothetical protein